MSLEADTRRVDDAAGNRSLHRRHHAPHRRTARFVDLVDDVRLQEGIAARGVHTRIRVARCVRLRVHVVLLRELLVDVREHRILLPLLVARGEVEHRLVLAESVVAAVFDEASAGRPGDLLLLRVGIGQATFVGEPRVGGVPIRVLHNRLAAEDPGVGIARLTIADLGVFERDGLGAALHRINLREPFLLGPLAVGLEIERLAGVNRTTVARIKEQARLILDLILGAIGGDVHGTAAVGRNAPHIPVVADVHIVAVFRPTNQCAVDRGLHLIVIVFDVPELRRDSRRDGLGRAGGEVEQLPVAVVVVGVLGVVRRERWRGTTTTAATTTVSWDLLLNELPLTRGHIHRVHIAEHEALDAGIALVVGDVCANGPRILGSDRDVAHARIGELHHLPLRHVVRGLVAEALVLRFLYLLLRLRPRVLPMPQNQAWHFGVRLRSGGDLTARASTRCSTAWIRRGEAAARGARAGRARFAQPKVNHLLTIAPLERTVAAHDESPTDAGALGADLYRLASSGGVTPRHNGRVFVAASGVADHAECGNRVGRVAPHDAAV